MNARWLTCVCRVKAADVPTVEVCLEELGVQALTSAPGEETSLVVDRLDGTHPLWPVVEVSGLFDEHADLGGLEAALSAAGVQPLAVRIETLVERDWQADWRAQFTPVTFGRLCICPSWCAPDPQAEHVVHIDPGMAFGTGKHATTAMCLEWLAAEPAIAGARVIDYGCGSGILALAAAALGACAVTAVDIDEDALAVCRENARRNEAESVHVTAPADLQPAPYDVVVANILLEPLIALQPTLTALCAPGASIVLTGILATQADALLAAYGGAFTMEPVRTAGDWALVAGRLQ